MRRTIVVLAVVIGFVAAATVPAGAEEGPSWDRRPFDGPLTRYAVTGQFGGDAATDVLWYAPGTGADAVWFGRAGRRGQSNMVKRSIAVNGSYQPIVGDFGGDGYDDVLWYAPGPTTDFLWTSTKGGYEFSSQPMSISGRYRWAVLRDHRGGRDDVVWVGLHGDRDYLWHFDDTGPTRPHNVSVSIGGTPTPYAGDFDANGYDDVLHYAPGSALDEVWLSTAQGTVERQAITLGQTYEPTVIRRSTGDDVVLRTDGPSDEKVLRGGPDPFAETRSLESFGSPASAVAFGRGQALLWNADLPETVLVDGATTLGYRPLADGPAPEGSFDVLTGDFDADGRLDLLWRAGVSELWYATT